MQYSDPVRVILDHATERAQRSMRPRNTADILFCLVEMKSFLTKKPLEHLNITLTFVEHGEGQEPDQEPMRTWEDVLQEATTIAIASGAAQLRSDILLLALTVVPGVAYKILEHKAEAIRERFPGIIVPAPEENERFIEEPDEELVPA